MMTALAFGCLRAGANYWTIGFSLLAWQLLKLLLSRISQLLLSDVRSLGKFNTRVDVAAWQLGVGMQATLVESIPTGMHFLLFELRSTDG